MILTFGEIMMRVKPEARLRFRQALPGKVEATFGGGEANVAVSVAMLGGEARFLTALPSGGLSPCVLATLAGAGVDTSCILAREEGRLGIYFLEAGANQRPSNVIYDRAYSAIALAEPEEYDMDAALAGVHWVHVTGITPAISENAYRATLELVSRAKQQKAVVSCDLNFRKKLWRWTPEVVDLGGAPDSPKALARLCMPNILRHVDVVIGNEEDASDVLDISAWGAEVEKGTLDAAAYEQVARTIAARFPNVSKVATTLRQSISANHNNWGAMLFDAHEDRVFFAPTANDGTYSPYAIHNIVDRVGGGDSFSAGLVFALNDADLSAPQTALSFAVAASCLKHSVTGDINYVGRSEVESLMKGSTTGRVQR